jgi:hypothetical protein
MRGSRASGRGTAAVLRESIAHRGPGMVFTTQDLLAEGLGASRSALDVGLKRLVDEGQLVRAGRGLFCVPERHPVIGVMPPEPRRLAEALVRRNGSQMLPMGPDAANSLGLSTQVVGRAVFYTTGRSGRRKLGNRTIELRQRSSRLAGADAIVATVIEALRILGKEAAASDDVRAHLYRSLNVEQKEQLHRQLHLAPEWMRSILRSVVSSSAP